MDERPGWDSLASPLCMWNPTQTTEEQSELGSPSLRDSLEKMSVCIANLPLVYVCMCVHGVHTHSCVALVAYQMPSVFLTEIVSY